MTRDKYVCAWCGADLAENCAALEGGIEIIDRRYQENLGELSFKSKNFNSKGGFT